MDKLCKSYLLANTKTNMNDDPPGFTREIEFKKSLVWDNVSTTRCPGLKLRNLNTIMEAI